MPESSDELTIRPTRPDEDMADLGALFELVFGFTASADQWRWKYLPPWSDRAYSWVGLMGDRIIGHGGVVPLRGWMDGRPAPFYQTVDLMVHPSFRLVHDYINLAVRTFIEEIKARDEPAVTYAISTHRAYLFFRRSGTITLIERANDVIVRPARDLALDARAGDDAVELRPWDWDNPEIDGIWDTLKSSIRIGLVRDRQYLEWRYARHPVFRYRLMGVYRRGQAVGWLVTGMPSPFDAGANDQVHVIDLMLPPAERRTILAEATDALEAESAWLWLPGNESGDFVETQPSRVYVLHVSRDSPIPTEDLQRDLYYTLGDVDWI